MRTRKVAPLAIVAFVVVASVITAVVLAFLPRHESHSLTVTSADGNAVQTPAPLTLAEARAQKCPIELPEGAGNVLFAAYAEWQAHEVYVKFEAPLPVCKAHAIRLLEEHNRQTSLPPVSLELEAIREPPRPVQIGPPLNVKWFDVESIKKDFMAGADGSHQPRIWIDADRSVLYYLYID